MFDESVPLGYSEFLSTLVILANIATAKVVKTLTHDQT
jgi:hypothetical protein